MAGKRSLTNPHIHSILGEHTVEELIQRLAPDTENLPRPIPPIAKVNANRTRRIWEALDREPDGDLLDDWTRDKLEQFEGNIENCIGTTKIPLGVAGPLRVNGLFAKGDYPIPLATSEAALVASYHRGALLITAVGGCTSMLLNQALIRTPVFVFKTLPEACHFVTWAMEQLDQFRDISATTTNHGKLIDISVTIEGNHVYLNFEFTTGDASGQNMVTIATEAVCRYIKETCPVAIENTYVEGNASGDKKASAQAFTAVRGRKVSAEVLLPADLLRKYLHASPIEMEEYWRVSAIGGVLSGTIGVQGHFANGLAAIYLATGQDVACVAESAMGVTRFEAVDDGAALYATVTLPGIMVGTVGGGTSLPSQQAALDLMGLVGDGCSQALAEVCCGLLLAGELSIIAAIATGEFTKAHKKLARG